jgi:hypothetical protein
VSVQARSESRLGQFFIRFSSMPMIETVRQVGREIFFPQGRSEGNVGVRPSPPPPHRNDTNPVPGWEIRAHRPGHPVPHTRDIAYPGNRRHPRIDSFRHIGSLKKCVGPACVWPVVCQASVRSIVAGRILDNLVDGFAGAERSGPGRSPSVELAAPEARRVQAANDGSTHRPGPIARQGGTPALSNRANEPSPAVPRPEIVRTNPGCRQNEPRMPSKRTQDDR